MANSTTNLDLLSSSQASKEAVANALFDAASASMVLGRRASTTSGLVWGYYGGVFTVNGVSAMVNNGTVNLTASNTNYIEFDNTAGTVAANTTGWTASGKTRMSKVITGTSTITSYEDWRVLGGSAGLVLNMYKEGAAGTANTVTGTNTGSVVIGSNTTLTNANYNYLIGYNNSASTNNYNFQFGYGNASTLGAYQWQVGYGNTGGAANYNFQIGYQCQGGTLGTYSVSMGARGKTVRDGAFHWSSGYFATQGDAQFAQTVLRASTTSTTAVELTADGATAGSGLITLQANSTVAFFARVVARQQTGTAQSCWEIRGLAKLGAAGTTAVLIGTPTVSMLFQDAAASTWSVAVGVGTNKVSLTGTGPAATNIRWVANVEITEVVYA